MIAPHIHLLKVARSQTPRKATTRVPRFPAPHRHRPCLPMTRRLPPWARSHRKAGVEQMRDPCGRPGGGHTHFPSKKMSRERVRTGEKLQERKSLRSCSVVSVITSRWYSYYCAPHRTTAVSSSPRTPSLNAPGVPTTGVHAAASSLHTPGQVPAPRRDA